MASSYSVVRHMHRDTPGRKNHRIDSIDATRHHRTASRPTSNLRSFSLRVIFFFLFSLPSSSFPSTIVEFAKFARFLLYIFYHHIPAPAFSLRFRDYIAVQITRARSSLLYTLTRVPFNGSGTVREARKASFPS